MDCTCQWWKDKHIKLTCEKCRGFVSYIKQPTVNENDDKKIILEKLKKQLNEKLADVAVLRMEIRELRNEIDDMEKI